MTDETNQESTTAEQAPSLSPQQEPEPFTPKGIEAGDAGQVEAIMPMARPNDPFGPLKTLAGDLLPERPNVGYAETVLDLIRRVGALEKDNKAMRNACARKGIKW